jgi:hypothetical protein
MHSPRDGAVQIKPGQHGPSWWQLLWSLPLMQATQRPLKHDAAVPVQARPVVQQASPVSPQWGCVSAWQLPSWQDRSPEHAGPLEQQGSEEPPQEDTGVG